MARFRHIKMAMAMAMAVATVLAVVAPVSAATRVAVVIGNANYGVVPLPNAGRDAELVAGRLAAIGFTVVTLYDVDSDGFALISDRISDRTAALIHDADIGVVYYAGHAVQIDGISNLLPVDLAHLSFDEIEAKKVPMSSLLSAGVGENGQGLRLFLIDACRNDPFSRLSDRIRVGLDTEKGVQLASASAIDTVIAYSTSSGQLASDGTEGDHGPYALALARYLDEPGLELTAITRQVARQVSDATDERQVPWVSGTLRNEYFG